MLVDRCIKLDYLNNPHGHFYICGRVKYTSIVPWEPPYTRTPSRNINCSYTWQEVEDIVNRDFVSFTGPVEMMKLFMVQFIFDVVFGLIPLCLSFRKDSIDLGVYDSRSFFIFVVIGLSNDLDSLVVNKKSYVIFFIFFEVIPIIIFCVNLKHMPIQFYTIAMFGKMVVFAFYKLITTIYSEYIKS